MSLKSAAVDANTLYGVRVPTCAAEVPCATCPFVQGNDQALARLAAEMVHPDAPHQRLTQALRPLVRLIARFAPGYAAKGVRRMARMIADERAAFVCHSSLYKFDGRNTTVKPESEWRLCRGAEDRKR